MRSNNYFLSRKCVVLFECIYHDLLVRIAATGSLSTKYRALLFNRNNNTRGDNVRKKSPPGAPILRETFSTQNTPASWIYWSGVRPVAHIRFNERGWANDKQPVGKKKKQKIVERCYFFRDRDDWKIRRPANLILPRDVTLTFVWMKIWSELGERERQIPRTIPHPLCRSQPLNLGGSSLVNENFSQSTQECRFKTNRRKGERERGMGEEREGQSYTNSRSLFRLEREIVGGIKFRERAVFSRAQLFQWEGQTSDGAKIYRKEERPR